MAKLSRTQINYLEDKLRRVVEDKVSDFKKSFTNESKQDLILKGLQDGSIKMISEKEIIKFFVENRGRGNSYYYTPNIDLTELVDKKDVERIEKIVKTREDKINDYSYKLRNAQQNALDKIVLEGVDVETAVAELNKIK